MWDYEIPISTIELPEGWFQTFPNISLREKLTWKSRRSQNKPFIRGVSPGIPFELWDKHQRLAKMEYCYSGKVSLSYGRWNRHVCHKGKCAADRPAQSTRIDPSMKQSCCSQSCLLSQVQRDTSDQDNSENLDYYLTIRHRCIDMWSLFIYLLSTLLQLMHCIFKCYYFGMTTVSFFFKIISITDEELFSETYVGCTASYFV